MNNEDKIRELEEKMATLEAEIQELPDKVIGKIVKEVTTVFDCDTPLSKQ